MLHSLLPSARKFHIFTYYSSFHKWSLSDFPSATKRMWWDYQPFNMISRWSPWTEQSSGSSLSCATKEPSTCGQPPTTSPGSSTTLWMSSGSCWPVWQLPCLSSQNVVCFVAGSLLKKERRGKEPNCIWDLSTGVPNLWDLMPDDLRSSWCNRNKVSNKCYVLDSSQNHCFHKTGSWGRKGWVLLLD